MAMKSDDTALFREIQRSAQKGMRVIETILPKVADDPFSLYLNGKELQYSQINDRTTGKLSDGSGGGAGVEGKRTRGYPF